MKRKILCILTSLCISVSCIVPFFVNVKAETLTPGRTNAYGSYYAETYFEYQNDSGITLNIPFVSIDLNNTLSSAFHLHFDFNNTYTGVMVITVYSSVAYKLTDCDLFVEGGYFQVIPTTTTSSTSKEFYIGLKDTSVLDFYIVHKGKSVNTAINSIILNNSVTFVLDFPLMDLDTSNNALLQDILFEAEGLNSILGQIYDYSLAGMDFTLSNILSTLSSQADYQINNESLLAYYFALNGNPVLMNNGDLSTSANIDNGSYTRPLAFEPGVTYYFYFYSSVNSVVLTAVNNRVTTTIETIPPTMSGYRLIKFTMVNEGDSTVTERFQWGQNIVIVPLYLGDGYGMSQEMQSITKHQSPNLTTNLLQQILDTLNGNSIELNDVTLFNNVMNNIANFFNGVVNIIPSSTVFENDINNTPPVIGPLSDLNFDVTSNVVQYFYENTLEVFPEFKLLVVVALVGLVLKVFI